MWIRIVVTATLLLAGCASPTFESASVTVVAYEALYIRVESVEQFLATRQVVATGEVIAVNDHAYEAPVDPNAEGNTETDGPEIFGTVSFKLESVLKGDLKSGSTLTIVYMSGRWNTVDKDDGRIAYTYDHMAHVQHKDATLKTPDEQSGATFAVFAAPNNRSNAPVKADNLYAGLAALVDAAGTVDFPGGLPWEPKAGATVKLDDLKAAIG